MFEINYEIEGKSLKAAAIHPFKKNLITYVIIAVCAFHAILAILSLVNVVVIENPTSSIVIGIVVPIILILMGLFAFRNAEKSHKKVNIQISENSFELIVIEDKENSTWHKALKIIETQELFMIYVMPYYVIPLDKRYVIDQKKFKEASSNCQKVGRTKFY